MAVGNGGSAAGSCVNRVRRSGLIIKQARPFHSSNDSQFRNPVTILFAVLKHNCGVRFRASSLAGNLEWCEFLDHAKVVSVLDANAIARGNLNLSHNLSPFVLGLTYLTHPQPAAQEDAA